MALRLVTAPTTLPVTLAEAKAHLRVDFDDDDTAITAMIRAAIAHAEQFTGRALIEQTWDLLLDAFPTGSIDLPRAPLIEVTGVYYLDSAGVEQTLSSSSYVVDSASEPARVGLVYGGTWPAALDQAAAVRVRFVAGYIDDASPVSANVPYDIKAAILLIVGSLYANREDVVSGQTYTLSWGAEALLRPHRVHTGMA